jgi:DNA invertase Pin-like site-specific DNA recombinase
MKVDEVISDDGVSGGVSYAERNLGKKLLPKTKEGDMIIVSEISRLGRSMFDLSKLIHTELKPRKLRLVVCNMSIDLRCDKLTAIDELILNNFSFAAQLEKQLISERTLSALEVKRKQGVKFGAASDKYKANRAKKDINILKCENMEKGRMKRERWQSKKETQMFAQIIRKEFPDHCTNDDITKWEWLGINCKRPHLDRMLASMAEYKSIDSSLFRKWDFSKTVSENSQNLRSYMQRFKRSYGIV